MALTLATITGLSAAWLGAAAAGAIVTVIVHLVGRWRSRIIEFPAQRFIAQVAVVSRRRSQPRNLMLLAVRSLMIVALALAFDRIGWATSRTASSGRDLVIVLDNSASMTRIAGNRSLFDRARDRALRRIDDAERDDVAVGVVEAGVRPRSLLPVTTRNYDALRSLVRAMTPSLAHADMHDAIAFATALQAMDGEAAARRVIVIGDEQATSVPESDAFGRHVGEWISVEGGAQTDNLAIVEALPVVISAGSGELVTVAAEIRSFGESDREVAVSLEIDGRESGWKRVAVPAEGTASVEFEVRPPGADITSVRWRILEEDALEADNERWTAIMRAVSPGAAIVTAGDASDGESGAYFSRIALAPTDELAVETITPVELAEGALSSRAVVVVSPGATTERQIDALASALRSGARVVYIADSQPARDSFGAMLLRQSMLPLDAPQIDDVAQRFVIDAIGADAAAPLTMYRLGAGAVLRVEPGGPLAQSRLVTSGALPELLRAFLIEGSQNAPAFVAAHVGESVTAGLRHSVGAELTTNDGSSVNTSLDPSGAPIVTLAASDTAGLRVIRNVDGDAVAVESIAIDPRESDLRAIAPMHRTASTGEFAAGAGQPALSTTTRPLWPALLLLVLVCACVEPLLARRAIA